MNHKKNHRFIIVFAVLMLLFSMLSVPVGAQSCPSVTVADSMGVSAGAFPYQYELAEYQELTGCTMTFSESPNSAQHNAALNGDAALPPVAERLPVDALVVVPQEEIGTYGGQLHLVSKSPESGTSHQLSTRHVNLFRFHEDLTTIVSVVAKSWEYNDDYTELTVTLREGHKWSDGAPFTADDIVFWYNDIKLNTDMYQNVDSIWVFGGEPMQVEAVDAVTVKFTFAAPAPNFVSFLARSYIQPFQPKHFMSQFHPAYNPDANANAQALGFESWTQLFSVYFHDWKDTYHPLTAGPEGTHLIVPTLESHVLSEETTDHRRYTANPYFFMVDTAGNQLPYYDEAYETYSEDVDLMILKLINGEVDYKDQSLDLDRFPELKQAELDNGGFRVFLPPTLGGTVWYAFNVTHQDPEMARIFGDIRFREAMSVAMNREEMNEIVYLGQGNPNRAQPVPFDLVGVPWMPEEYVTQYTQYDPDMANSLLDEMGLTNRDNEGFRTRFDGQRFVVLLQYAPQGGPIGNHELAKQYWEAVGVRVELKEVTSDFYRTESSQNRHDIATWLSESSSLISLVGNTQLLTPPFGDFLSTRTGTQWNDWVTSGGTSGIEPPADILSLYDLASEFKSQPMGSEGQERVGLEIAQIFADTFLFIGAVGEVPSPVYVSDRVGNFQEFTEKSYDFYWAYPFRPIQWFVRE